MIPRLDYINRRSLEKLWFIYGNNGPKHTHGNHRFIQCLLEKSTDEREFFKSDISQECLTEVDKILKILQ